LGSSLMPMFIQMASLSIRDTESLHQCFQKAKPTKHYLFIEMILPIGCPYHTGYKYSNDAALGYQYKRGASMASDWIMQAGRRYTAQMYADAGLPTFSYMFNQTPYSGVEPGVVEKEPVGVPHFHDVSQSL
jgi:hypothetical protein